MLRASATRPRVLPTVHGARFARLASCLLCLAGIAAVTLGVWRLTRPLDQKGIIQSAAMAALLDIGHSLQTDIVRTVTPAMQRTKKLAADAAVIDALRGGDPRQLTAACNAAILQSTEIDACALFDSSGRIVAINTIFPTGEPIGPERVARVMGMSFDGRDIIQKCLRTTVSQPLLEFQTRCDITPALFDSTGLSVAYSVPIIDPASGLRIGVVSSRMRFDRLTRLISNRQFAGPAGSTEFITDEGKYFSEEINSGQRPPPIPPAQLAGMVAPLSAGRLNYCFTQRDHDYVSLFRMADLSTLGGGGIQVMLVANEDWLASEARQSRASQSGLLIALGVLLVLFAVVVKGVASLRQSERWNRMLIDTALDAVVVVDQDGIVRQWNPQCQETFGFTAAEACGRAIQDLVVPDRLAEKHRAAIKGYLGRGADEPLGRRLEVQAVRKDRAEITVEFVVRPVRVGERRCFCAFVRDVTEQRVAQTQLGQAQKLESIGQMAAGIAHEINTPAQYVGDNTRFVRDGFRGLLALLDRHDVLLRAGEAPRPWAERVREIDALRAEVDLNFLRAEIPKALDQSIEGLESISKIVRAMKEFSHPGGDEKELADLNAAIESTATVCRNRWKYVADLELDLDRGLPGVPVLLGEFNQVVLNLIVNASDAIAERLGGAAGEPKGSIRVTTARVGNAVEIRVHDNGGGIPDHVKARLFEPFFTTKPVGKGTGQGLTISRNSIVKKHGGELFFESAPGSTTFVIRLPMTQPVSDRVAA